MTPRNHRSLAIFIVLTVLQSQASSFTIKRSTDTTESLLAVRHELSSRSTDPRSRQTTARLATRTTDNQHAPSEVITTKQLLSRNPKKSTATTKPPTTLVTTTEAVTSTQVTSTEVTTEQAITSQVTASASALVSTDQKETKESTTEQTNTTESSSDTSSDRTKPTSDKPANTTNERNTTYTTRNVSLAYVDNSAVNSTRQRNNVPGTIIADNDTNVDQKTELNNVSYSTEPVTIGTTTDLTSSDFDDSSQQTTIMTQSTLDSSSINTETNFSRNTTENQEITNSKRTEKWAERLTAADSDINAVPNWKKYKVIDRKRFTTLPDRDTSSSELDDLVKAGTAQYGSSDSLEKALNITPDIPSLVELKNEILALNKFNSSTTISAKIEDTSTESYAESTNQTETILTSSTEALAETTRIDVISSKRAGFLNFSVKPVQPDTTTLQQIKPIQEETTTVQQTDNLEILGKDTNTPVETTTKNIQRETTTSQTIPVQTETMTTISYQPDDYTVDVLRKVTSAPLDTTTKEFAEKGTSKTSQSQLAEDAINEELMKEESLSDYVDAKRQRMDKEKESSSTKALAPQRVQPIPTDTSTEDKLSVKPIRLYTVNPNYKPLKKIDIQPPKSFMRNPDDNSWRNESLSSLGIVFKANNSSKPFTEVLKNKTETEWNVLLEKYSKSGETAELRERLEKIAEQRKSKKKKINQLGETVYTDYEETTSSERISPIKPKVPEVPTVTYSPITTTTTKEILTTTPATEIETTKYEAVRFDFESFKTKAETTTGKSKVIDDYEPEEDEPDYTLPNIDIKKFITPPRPDRPSSLRPPFKFTDPPVRPYVSDRKPTIQYFPPREKPKVVFNDYDTEFQKKLNSYTTNGVPSKSTPAVPPTVVTIPTVHYPKHKYEQQQRPNDIIRRPENLNKNIYLTQPPITVPVEGITGYVVNPDGTYNRGTYVIKHLRDFIEDVVKADEIPHLATDAPIRGLTASPVQDNRVRPPADYYDYEAQFRKDVLNKFVENFNQNSERFKSDFPVLYNTSVIHGKEVGREASSTAFMKRLYEDARAIQRAGAGGRRAYEPPCDRNVELAPAYELHYFVPEEEEKEEFDPRAVSSSPYIFRL